MQPKNFYAEDDIRNTPDPISSVFSPLSKLKMVSTIISNEACNRDTRPFETFTPRTVGALGDIINDAADEINFLANVASERVNILTDYVQELKDRDSNETRHPTASFFLSEISSHDAKTLLEFMQLHLPGCKQLNPDMTWEESHAMGEIFEKVRAVLYCLAREKQDKEVTL